ncbi:hypothetical protein MBAV_001749 [Candidatus Magnetobacterium bavaricum]|uniref:Uncharacterized protein n=1 Tax=Candidatus Magnetobacterium bavaricum TaxID=29290 RepID=A0A0F3GVZ0_9BACT|nr:hypothetical protein MBAV_001749 [Candidatus Magnetobacterium bavaricum]
MIEENDDNSLITRVDEALYACRDAYEREISEMLTITSLHSSDEDRRKINELNRQTLKKFRALSDAITEWVRDIESTGGRN